MRYPLVLLYFVTVCIVWVGCGSGITKNDPDLPTSTTTGTPTVTPTLPPSASTQTVINEATSTYAGATNPRVAAVGTYLYVVWTDDRLTGTPEVMVHASADEGASWTGPEARLQSSGPVIGGSYPDIAATGTYVHVVWEDNRNGNDDVYYARSANNGTTWSTAQMLNTTIGSICIEPKVACSGSNVVMTYIDGHDLFCNYSTDSGATWQSSCVRVNANLSTPLWPHCVAVSGSNVYAAWVDERNGAYDIYANASTDGGATWLPSDSRLDTDTQGASTAQRPTIAANGSNVYVAWRNGSAICFSTSTDSGSTWSASMHTFTASGADYPHLVYQDSRIYLVWQQSSSIYWTYSANGGTTWAVPIDLGSGSFPQTMGGQTYGWAVFSEGTGGNIVSAWSHDLTTWPSLVDCGNTLTASTNFFPQTARTTNLNHVFWSDNQGTAYQIYHVSLQRQ